MTKEKGNMLETKNDAIEAADAHLRAAGLPTYSQLNGLLRAQARSCPEWRDKVMHPCQGQPFQNWLVHLYLPVPLDATDKSPEAAIERFLASAVGT